jgi:hypothetical protein
VLTICKAATRYDGLGEELEAGWSLMSVSKDSWLQN